MHVPSWQNIEHLVSVAICYLFNWQLLSCLPDLPIRLFIKHRCRHFEQTILGRHLRNID